MSLKKSSQVGTTEEAIANAEKIGFKCDFKAKHPFIKNKMICFCSKLYINGLWNRCNIWCPAHDQRDYDFATKYNLEIIK